MKIFKLLFRVLLFGAAAYGSFKLVRKMNNGQLSFNLRTELDKDQKAIYKQAHRIDLNNRQQEIFDLIMRKKKIDMQDLISIKGVTTRTLRRDLNKLVSEKLIRKEGKTKSARYILIGE